MRRPWPVLGRSVTENKNNTNSLYKRSLNNVIEHDINRETLQAIYLMRVFQCPTTRKANVLNGE
jgi:hypothetical protein